MKRLLLAAITALFTLTAWADGEMGLYIIDSAENTIPVSDIQKITFENGAVVVKLTSGDSSSYTISGISRMYFGELATGIQNVSDDANKPWDGKNINVASNMEVQVYSVSGTTVARGNFSKGDVINLDYLPGGVYIVKMGNKSFKIAK